MNKRVIRLCRLSRLGHTLCSWLRANKQVLNKEINLLLFILILSVLEDFVSFSPSRLHPADGTYRCS